MSEATIRNAVRAALAGAICMAASFSWAQTPEPPTTAEPPATVPPEPATTEAPAVTDSTAGAQTTIDEKKIDQFADAYIAVQKIQADTATQLDNSADDPAKQQAAQAKAENEMIAAVERSGLKLEEFNGIVQTMSADPNLRARVVAKIRERMGS